MSLGAQATVQLSLEDQYVLSEAADAVGKHDLVTSTEEFVLEAQIHAARLSEPLRRAMTTFRRFGNAAGGVLIRGVPLGLVPPTPTAPGLADAPAQPAAAMSVVLACLGEQYGFRPEYGGRIVQSIVPVRGFEAAQISVGSVVDLECHVEMAFSPYRSDYVALLCVRQDHEGHARTTLSSADEMLSYLAETTVQLLREPRFRTKVDTSFRLGDGLTDDVWVSPISVLEGSRVRPRLRVDFAETEGLDRDAQSALVHLQNAASASRTGLRLQAGDLLVIDNHRALHGRTAFVPRYDGQDRWLLRSFITNDLRRSDHLRPEDGRIVDPDYGETALASRGVVT